MQSFFVQKWIIKKKNHLVEKSTISQKYKSWGKSEHSKGKPEESSNNDVLRFEVNLITNKGIMSKFCDPT